MAIMTISSSRDTPLRVLIFETGLERLIIIEFSPNYWLHLDFDIYPEYNAKHFFYFIYRSEAVKNSLTASLQPSRFKIKSVFPEKTVFMAYYKSVSANFNSQS